MIFRKLLFLLALFIVAQVAAKPELEANKRYQLVCEQYPGGCVTDGSTANANTPLYYLATANTAASSYWIIEEQEEGLFSIKNADTGKYITYDGVRMDYDTDGQTRRYVDMTNAMDGNKSLWSFQQQGNGYYAIRNAGQNDHIWDVRTDSYVVGTYSMSSGANSNQKFRIYDESGALVTEKATETSGIDVSTWIDATAETLSGWNNQGSWSMAPSGNYQEGESFISYPFIEKWHSTNNGGLPDGTISQELTHLPAGQYSLEADMIAVFQDSRNPVYYGTSANGVTLFIADVTTSVSTYSNRPKHYTLDFTLNSSQTVTMGVRLQSTNANWVALDNLQLYFHGTAEELLTGEQAKVKADLTDILGEDEATTMIGSVDNTVEELETLRKKASLMPHVDPISKILTSLTIGGHAVNYAKSTELYLCSVPLNVFGTDLSVEVDYTPKNGWGNLFIDDNEVEPGDNYTFADVTGNKTYILSIKADDNTTVSYPLTFTSLPVVKIYGEFSNDYSEGYISVSEPNKTSALEMLDMKAKWRGGITNGSGKHKRNYHVKLKDAAGEKLERKFFGLRKDNSWILESCQVDMSRIRNRTLTDLWNDFSTPPYYISEEPKALTGTRGNFVELILNDEYRGIYCMTENMDRKQMKLKKYDEENNVTHGQLWKSKDWTYAVMMGTSPDGGYWPKYELSETNENSESWDQYYVKYPDFEDYGYQTDWSTLYNAVDFVCHSSDDEFRQHVAEYLDLPLVIDYYILQETILSTDNHGKNMFFAVYDKQEDKKITFGVWDMDATCGQRWSDSYYHSSILRPDQDYAEFIQTHEHGDYNLFKRLRDTDAENFNARVRKRYRDLRQNELATESILSRFQTYLDEFKKAGSDEREYARWDYDSDIDGHKLDFDDEMYYLTDWFTRRMTYLDETRFDISSLPNKGDVNGDGETNIADAMAIVNHILKKPSASFEDIAADVNMDGETDIADAMAIVNIILKKTDGARSANYTRNPY